MRIHCILDSVFRTEQGFQAVHIFSLVWFLHVVRKQSVRSLVVLHINALPPQVATRRVDLPVGAIAICRVVPTLANVQSSASIFGEELTSTPKFVRACRPRCFQQFRRLAIFVFL